MTPFPSLSWVEAAAREGNSLVEALECCPVTGAVECSLTGFAHVGRRSAPELELLPNPAEPVPVPVFGTTDAEFVTVSGSFADSSDLFQPVPPEEIQEYDLKR